MANFNDRKIPPPVTRGGNGYSHWDRDEEPVGELFKRLSSDASHLVQQEINLARIELKETGIRMGQTAAKLGTAFGIAVAGMIALMAFVVIALGEILDNYWLSALIVALAFMAVAAFMARRAIAALKEDPIGMPETAVTLREDAQWARNEAREVKRELTA